jgi:hypothetical protein
MGPSRAWNDLISPRTPWIGWGSTRVWIALMSEAKLAVRLTFCAFIAATPSLIARSNV